MFIFRVSLIICIFLSSCSNDKGLLYYVPFVSRSTINIESISQLSSDHVMLCFCDRDYLPYENFYRTISDFCQKYGWNVFGVGTNNRELFNAVIPSKELVNKLEIRRYPTVFSLNTVNGVVVRLAEGEFTFIELEREAEKIREKERTTQTENLKLFRKEIPFIEINQ